MPELPDVDAHRKLVAAEAAGRRVHSVTVPDADLLLGTTPQGLGRSLVGRTVEEPWRRGKWLFIPFGGPLLLVHFRMTGWLTWDDPPDPDPDHDALCLHFDAGVLSYRTRRRLGSVTYLRAGDDPETVTGPLGPDATEVDRDQLGDYLGARRGSVKGALMDQEGIAGLGNELVDEMLWRARMHPRARASKLGADRVAELHRRMREVLTRSLRAGHVPSGPTWLNGQRDADTPTCPRCHAPLERATVVGRTTLWCPEEQAR